MTARRIDCKVRRSGANLVTPRRPPEPKGVNDFHGGSLRLAKMSTTTTSFTRLLSFTERQRAAVTGTPIPMERRSKSRYPLDLSVRFRLSLGSGTFLLGTGRTVNLSAGGILVYPEDVVLPDEIRNGAWVEIRIAWPILLDGRIPLQLLGVGRVIRHGAIDFAATFERHQFRTMKVPDLPDAS